MWSDTRITDLLGLDLPIIQAPMAGAQGADLAIAVCEAGGLGSLGCAMLGPEQLRAEVGIIRQRTSRPINLNFFCHRPPAPDAEREAIWRKRLGAYYKEFGIDTDFESAAGRRPFDEATCDLVLELAPGVVSFHFGLPDAALLDRVKASGAKILSSATTVEEAKYLERHGCDAVIAQGFEAGGHRGMFLSRDISTQIGLFSLLPQVVDAVDIPVIAAGGIADARGAVAAHVLGASAVQIGTAYLRCNESTIKPVHREALRSQAAQETVLTNVFTGRPARGVVNRIIREVGPMSDDAPVFPLATGAVAPLRAVSESAGDGDFLSLWSGQSAALGRETPAGEFTRELAAEVARLLPG